jgi:H/ACA ribonucleoprotein complex subunit 4
MWYWKNENNDKLLRHVVQPIENAVSHLGKVWVMDTTVDTLCHGADLAVPGVAKLHGDIEEGQTVALMTLKDELVALGVAKIGSKEMMSKSKGIAVKTKKVFMEPGVYPKVQRKEN